VFSSLVSRMPPGWIRWFGRMQYKLPLIGPVIGWFGRNVLASEGVIRHGVGAGLKFDARGGVPGFLFGTTEPHEQELLARSLKPGDVFYDIGANVGFFATLAAHLVGPQGRVYAFEPNPTCAKQVRKNAALNHFTHLEVTEAAVSSSPGKTRLQLGHITGASTIVGGGSDGGLEVAVVSIDEFVREHGAHPPRLVMIDAEGAEIEVLKGMAGTIAQHRPVIMCEVHWIGDRFLSYCAEHLRPLGYTVEPLGGGQFPTGPSRFHAVLTPGPSAS
jgi:FkbM family methyltransferase